MTLNEEEEGCDLSVEMCGAEQKYTHFLGTLFSKSDLANSQSVCRSEVVKNPD